MNAILVLASFVCLFPPQDGLNVSLRGTVVDGKDRPIAGARVNIATASPRVGQGLFCPSCYLDCRKWTLSDDQGRFEIRGLNPTLTFRLLATSPDMKAQLTKPHDPLLGRIEIVLRHIPAEFPPERTIAGQVVDDRGEPLKSVLVEVVGAKTADKRMFGTIRDADPSVTDKDGRFRLFLPKDLETVDLDVIAPGHAGARFESLSPGSKVDQLVVPSGTRVTGRLVREGKAMPGLQVAVVQTDRRGGRHFIKAVGDVTDADGKFKFDYLPANETYAIFTLVGEGAQPFVITTKKFMAADNRKTRDLGNLEVIAPLRIAGRFELAQGQSLPPDTKIVLGRDPAWDLIEIPVSQDGSFVIDGVPPETYTIGVRAKGFAIDGGRLPFQMSRSPTHFGMRLQESMDDLRIPLLRRDVKD